MKPSGPGLQTAGPFGGKGRRDRLKIYYNFGSSPKMDKKGGGVFDPAARKVVSLMAKYGSYTPLISGSNPLLPKMNSLAGPSRSDIFAAQPLNLYL